MSHCVSPKTPEERLIEFLRYMKVRDEVTQYVLDCDITPGAKGNCMDHPAMKYYEGVASEASRRSLEEEERKP